MGIPSIGRAHGDTIQKVTPDWKKLWLDLERTLDKRRRKVEFVRKVGVMVTQLNKGRHCTEGDD